MITIEQLNIYPLKSGRVITRPSVRLAATGFEWDRWWMLTDAGGQFLSQRTHPQLALIQPELSDSELTLHVAGSAPLVLPLAPCGASTTVQVWKDRCEALDQGDGASEWASDLLGQRVRLVRAPPAPRRLAAAEFAGPNPPPVAFADGFPLLVCNRASLDYLNSRMPQPVAMERFRPNLVLHGLEPFAEDRIESLQVGGVTLRLVKPCTRCVITSTDQHSGERSTNPLPVLREFRFDHALRGVTFGENAIPTSDSVGCEVFQGATCLVTYDTGAS
jgi:uncharacterized protein YcbX